MLLQTIKFNFVIFLLLNQQMFAFYKRIIFASEIPINFNRQKSKFSNWNIPTNLFYTPTQKSMTIIFISEFFYVLLFLVNDINLLRIYVQVLSGVLLNCGNKNDLLPLYNLPFDSFKGANIISFILFLLTFFQHQIQERDLQPSMETVIQNPQFHQPQQLNSQDQAKNLFDDASVQESNPFQNLELSSQNQQQIELKDNQGNDNEQEEIDFRQMMRMSKKEKKKDKKLRKLKQAKERKQSRKENRNQNIKETQKSNYKVSRRMLLDSSEDQAQIQVKPQQQNANLKSKKSSKKVTQNSDDDQKLSSKHEDDSDEYSSQNQASESDQLAKMNPNSEKQGTGRKLHKKKLGKKTRQQRILQKQGFDLRELGNDADANYELNESLNESDDSYSEGGKKKKGSKRVKKNQKEKKPKLTNEQFLGKLQQLGREDQVDDNDSDKYNYDSGLNELQKLRPKKQSSNKIKIQNKLFGNIEMDLDDENNQQNQAQMPEQALELQIKPKSVTSSRASSFLNKVEALKKHRGLQADIDQEEFDKITKEKAKKSISQLISKINNQVEENQEIDIEIKAPTIAKGKSADLINNTMFIVKNLSQKQSSTVSSENLIITDATNAANQQLNHQINKPQQQKAVKTLVVPLANTVSSRKGVSRSEFFKQIRTSINVRKSKYISDDELKNSMKASKLEDLEEIRKKIQEKRRKDAMYELGEMEDDDADNVINELEADLARQKGISPAEYKKLLQMEDGLEVLEDYQEAQQKKKKRKQGEENVEPKVAFELTIDQTSNNITSLPQGSQQQKQNHQLTQQQQKMKKVLQIKRQLRIQKAMAMQREEIEEGQSQRHADDMIEEYEGEELKQNEEEEMMELEEGNDEEGDGEYEEEEGEEAKDEDDMEEDEEAKEEDGVQASNNQSVGDSDIKNQQNQQVIKQLEQQGIILPGNRNKPQTSNKNPQPQLDFSKYLAQNQNGQPISSQIVHEKPSIPLKANEDTLQFKEFRKLRKIAVVIQEKKKKRQEQLKRAKQFFQQQAQLGSDNQENDDNVKAINKKDDQQEEDGDDLDQELEQLIDNAVDINQADQQQAFKKYMEDVKEKDRQQLQRILRGDFRRQNQDMPQMQQMQEDQRNRMQRMQRMFQRLQRREQNENDLYAKDESDEEEIYYYDKNGKRKRVENKKNTSHDNAQDSPQEDDGELEKKLQFYLMDTISPAKKDEDVKMNTDLIMELPMMNKKSTMSKLSDFAKKSQENQQSLTNQQEKYNHTPSKASFAGNLLNLAAPKGQQNQLSIPKMKRTTSHMSEYLNKNKIQKPIGFTGASFKLPGIFNRMGKK